MAQCAVRLHACAWQKTQKTVERNGIFLDKRVDPSLNSVNKCSSSSRLHSRLAATLLERRSYDQMASRGEKHMHVE